MFDIKKSLLDFEHEGSTFVGMTVDDLRASGVSADVILGAVANRLCVLIDMAAENARLAFITPGAGQAQEYAQVEKQAEAALATGPTATASQFPMLAATIGLDIDPETKKPATDILGVARSVLAASDLWVLKGSEIRTTRLNGKAAVRAAPTVDAAIAAAASLSWPTA